MIIMMIIAATFTSLVNNGSELILMQVSNAKKPDILEAGL